MKMLATSLLALALACASTSALAENMPNTASSEASLTLHDIQKTWASANYLTEDEDEQIAAFEKLIANAKALTKKEPENADYWIWLGITQSTFAGVKGGLGALEYAKNARTALEKALELNPQALNGSAYTSLGTLFHKVPGWPIGFGSDKTAKKMLTKALEINPNGIDPNYFYGEFLYNKRKYKAAKKHLVAAKEAPARPSRPIADIERQKEIEALMIKVDRKLKRS